MPGTVLLLLSLLLLLLLFLLVSIVLDGCVWVLLVPIYGLICTIGVGSAVNHYVDGIILSSDDFGWRRWQINGDVTISPTAVHPQWVEVLVETSCHFQFLPLAS